MLPGFYFYILKHWLLFATGDLNFSPYQHWLLIEYRIQKSVFHTGAWKRILNKNTKNYLKKPKATECLRYGNTLIHE